MPSVLQDWVMNLTYMQQGVLLGGMRGADGVPKYNSTKYLLRWYRRCTLVIAFGPHRVLNNPLEAGGGSYTGPSVSIDLQTSSAGLVEHWEKFLEPIVDNFIQNLDGLPHHFVQHFRNGIQIIGYKHPNARIRQWWYHLYLRLVNDEHLYPESVEHMNKRLGDNYEDWRKQSDDAISH